MENLKRHLVTLTFVGGGIALGTHVIVNEIQNQGELIRQEIEHNLHNEGDDLKLGVDESVNNATEELKTYIISLTLDD